MCTQEARHDRFPPQQDVQRGGLVNVGLSSPRVLSLCSGFGGLELALRLVFGECCSVAYCERDYAAIKILAQRMDDGAIPAAPIWSNISTFPGQRFAGCVDIVTAGFPCQPFSVAGKRLGLDDERWIWPDIARIIRDVEPRFVFLENVPGLIRHGLGPVLGSLAEAGFDAEWDCFTATEIGAPHKRERVFILAYRDGGGFPLERQGAITDTRHNTDGREPEVADARCAGNGAIQHVAGAGGAATDARVGGEALADADSGRRWSAVRVDSASESLSAAQWQKGNALSGATSKAVGDANGGRFSECHSHERGVHEHHAAGRRLFPPGPNDTDGWRRYLAEGGPQPSVRRGADGTAARLDRLFALGNGVVPIVAAKAFLVLAKRAGIEVTP